MAALLSLLDFPPPKDENYTVQLEKPDRVDIAAISSGEFAVFIENKVFAGEQDNQFGRLIDSLIAHADHLGIPSQRRAAVFLTNDGRAPSVKPVRVHLGLAVFNLRRDDVVDAFRSALAVSPVKSPLLVSFVESYRRSISALD